MESDNPPDITSTESSSLNLSSSASDSPVGDSRADDAFREDADELQLEDDSESESSVTDGAIAMEPVTIERVAETASVTSSALEASTGNASANATLTAAVAIQPQTAAVGAAVTVWDELRKCRGEVSALRSAYDALLNGELAQSRMRLLDFRSREKEWSNEKKELLKKEYRLLQVNNELLAEVDSVNCKFLELKQSAAGDLSVARLRVSELSAETEGLKQASARRRAQFQEQMRVQLLSDESAMRDALTDAKRQNLVVSDQMANLQLERTLLSKRLSFYEERVGESNEQLIAARKLHLREKQCLTQALDTLKKEVDSYYKKEVERLKEFGDAKDFALRKAQSALSESKRAADNQMSVVQSQLIHSQSLHSTCRHSLLNEKAQRRECDSRIADLRSQCQVYDCKLENLEQMVAALSEEKRFLSAECRRVRRDPSLWIIPQLAADGSAVAHVTTPFKQRIDSLATSQSLASESSSMPAPIDFGSAKKSLVTTTSAPMEGEMDTSMLSPMSARSVASMPIGGDTIYKAKYVRLCEKYQLVYGKYISLCDETERLKQRFARQAPVLKRHRDEMDLLVSDKSKCDADLHATLRTVEVLRNELRSSTEKTRAVERKWHVCVLAKEELQRALASKLDVVNGGVLGAKKRRKQRRHTFGGSVEVDFEMEEERVSGKVLATGSDLLRFESSEELVAKHFALMERAHTLRLDCDATVKTHKKASERLKQMLGEALQQRDDLRAEIGKITALFEEYRAKRDSQMEALKTQMTPLLASAKRSKRRRKSSMAQKSAAKKSKEEVSEEEVDEDKAVGTAVFNGAVDAGFGVNAEASTGWGSFGAGADGGFGTAETSGWQFGTLPSFESAASGQSAANGKHPEKDKTKSISMSSEPPLESAESGSDSGRKKPAWRKAMAEQSEYLVAIEKRHEEYISEKIQQITALSQRNHELELQLRAATEKAHSSTRQVNESESELSQTQHKFESSQKSLESMTAARDECKKQLLTATAQLEQMRSDMRTSVEQFKFEKESHELKVSGLEARIEALQTARTRMSDELLDIQRTLNTTQSQLTETRREADDLRKMKVTKKRKTSEVSTASALPPGIELMDDSSDNEERESSSKAVSGSGDAERKQRAKEEWSDLKTMLAKNQKQFTENMREKMALISEVTKLQTQLRDTETRLKQRIDCESKASALEVQFSKCQRELSETKSQLAAATQHTADLSGVKQEFERLMQIHRPRMSAEEMDEIVSKLQGAERQNAQMTESIAALSDDLKVKAIANTALTTSLKDVNNEKDAFDEAMQKMAARLEVIASDLKLFEKVDAVADEIAANGKDASDERKDASAVSEEVSTLSQRVDKMGIRCEELLHSMKSRVTAAATHEAEMQTEFTETCEKLSILEAKFESELLGHSETNSELVSVRKEALELRQSNEQIDSAKTELLIELEKLKEDSQSQIAALSTEKKEVSSRCEHLMEEQLVLNANMKMLNDSLETMRTQQKFDVDVVPTSVASDETEGDAVGTDVANDQSADSNGDAAKVQELGRHISKLTTALERNKQRFFDEVKKHKATLNALVSAKKELAELQTEFGALQKTLATMSATMATSATNTSATGGSEVGAECVSAKAEGMVSTKSSAKHGDFLKTLSDSSKLFEENKGLKLKLTALLSRCKSQREELEEISKERSSLKNRLDAFKSGMQSLSGLRADKDSAEKKSSTLQAQLKKKSEGFEKAKQVIKMFKENIGRLNAEKQRLEKDLSSETDKVNQLSAERIAQRDANAELHAKADAFKLETGKLKAALGDAERNLNDVFTDVSKKSAEIESLKQQLADALETAKKTTAELSAAKAATTSESATMASAKGRAVASSGVATATQFEEVKKKLNKAMQLLRLKAKNEASLKVTVDTQHTIIEKLRKLVSQQRDRLSAMGDAPESVLQTVSAQKHAVEIAKREENIKELRAEVEECRQMVDASQTVVDTVNSKLTQVMARNKHTADELQQRSEQLKAAKLKLDASIGTQKSQTEEVHSMSERIEELKQENKAKSTRIGELEAAAIVFKGRLQQRQLAVESMTLSTLSSVSANFSAEMAQRSADTNDDGDDDAAIAAEQRVSDTWPNEGIGIEEATADKTEMSTLEQDSIAVVEDDDDDVDEEELLAELGTDDEDASNVKDDATAVLSAADSTEVFSQTSVKVSGKKRTLRAMTETESEELGVASDAAAPGKSQLKKQKTTDDSLAVAALESVCGWPQHSVLPIADFSAAAKSGGELAGVREDSEDVVGDEESDGSTDDESFEEDDFEEELGEDELSDIPEDSASPPATVAVAFTRPPMPAVQSDTVDLTLDSDED